MRPTGPIITILLLIFVGGFTLLLYFGALDRKGSGQYDERQLRARGKGFELGFYTMVLAGVCYYLAESTFDRELTVPGVAQLMMVCLGITVMSVYCILKDAFVAVKGSRAATLICMGIVGVWGFCFGFTRFMDEGALSEGRLSECWMYFSFAIAAVIIFLTLLIKVLTERRERE